MPLIPDDVIDAVLARTDIAEVIGRYVALKRAGRHFKALCPFHKEKTPSFNVNTDKQIFHCFGCGVGGNVFSFLMQHDRLSFPEAVRQLAEHVGVPVPDVPGEDRGAHERHSSPSLLRWRRRSPIIVNARQVRQDHRHLRHEMSAPHLMPGKPIRHLLDALLGQLRYLRPEDRALSHAVLEIRQPP